MNRHLNNERQESRTDYVKVRTIAARGGKMKKVKEGEYG
jgi:hypothetical protein